MLAETKDITYYDKAFLERLLGQMLLIRRFEEKAAQMYGLRKIGGFCHIYIGQEAVCTGAIAAVDLAKDYAITAYRDHGHAITVGMDPKIIMAGSQVDGMDAVAVYESVKDAVALAREHSKPSLLEIRTYRYLGHSMSDPATYRTKEELAKHKIQDPIVILKDRMIAEGDTVAIGDVLCEIETDKATMDYESPADGVLLKISAREGQTVPIGDTIAIIGEKGEQIESSPLPRQA